MSPSGEIAGYFSLPPTYYATQGFVRDRHGTTTAFSFPERIHKPSHLT